MKLIIIGATSGLIHGTAELLAKDTHIVEITGRRKELLEEIESLYPTT